MSMSASSTMEDVNIAVPTLRATLAAPVTLAIVWTSITSTVQVKCYSYRVPHGIYWLSGT